MSRQFSANLAKRYLFIFIFVHLLVWTLGPTWVRGSVTHDTLESIAWGLQWQWGYNKHPFLTAWACALITKLFGTVGWPVYLLAQMAIATTFWAVWRLASKILSTLPALIATLSLEGVLFYNLNSFNLTPDSLQSPLWALLALSFYQAVTSQALRYWLLTGILAALAISTKYQVALLFLPMLGFCLSNPIARQSFKREGIYLGLALMLVMISPHLVWLYQHDFITLTYAFGTPKEYTHQQYGLNHLIYPLRYLANNLGNIMGLLILLWPFYRAEKTALNLGPFNWQFLLWLGLGPLGLSILLCVITGSHFPPRWSTPYFFLLGILLMAWLKPNISPRQLKQFILTLIVLGSLIWLGRMGSIVLGSYFEKDLRSDTYQPNQQMAEYLTTLWQQRFHRPLAYIAGSHYLVAALSVYSPSQPKPYFDWSYRESPWINEADLEKQGALVVWDVGSNYTWDAESAANTQLPKAIRERFPNLEFLGNMQFNRLTKQHAPLTIGVALLPPKGT